MKRTLSLLVAVVMLALPALSLAASNDHTDYSQFPLVAEGESLTVSVVIPRNDSYGQDPDKQWFWVWSEQATGIDFDVRQISSSAIDENKNLMFAADDLPDVILGMKMTTGELMRYGVQEGQLLDFSEYINEDNMPYLTKWMEAYPDTKAFATTPDGKMYTLPYMGMNSDRVGSQEGIHISKEWLEKTEMAVPETLEDFIAFLYKCKEIDPESTPISGLAKDRNPISYFLNALGFLTDRLNDFGNLVGMREGEVVIPATEPVFKEYLRILNQLYADGIIMQDFFTAPALAVDTLMTEGKTAIFGSAPYMVLPQVEDFHKWDSVKPLTSEWNATQQWMDSSPYGIGFCSMSANTDPEKIDTILRYLDFFYSELGIFYIWEGPLVGSADTLDMVVGMDFQNNGKYFNDVVNGDYESSLHYVHAIGPGLAGTFNRSHSILYPDKYTTMMETLQFCLGVPDDEIDHTALKYDHGDNYARLCMLENISPYVVPGYPILVYYDEETQETIDDITILLDPHIESEVAKFITGARSLDEFDKFVDECYALGAKELRDIYAAAYQNYLDTL